MEVSSISNVGHHPRKYLTDAQNSVMAARLPCHLQSLTWDRFSVVVYFIGTRTLWKYIDVIESRVVHPSYVHSAMESILDRQNDWILISTSSPSCATSVYLIHMDWNNGTYRQDPIEIVNQASHTLYVGVYLFLLVSRMVH